MSQEYSMRVIARIHTDFSTKFGVPRQSGLVDALESTIVFEPEFGMQTHCVDWKASPICG